MNEEELTRKINTHTPGRPVVLWRFDCIGDDNHKGNLRVLWKALGVTVGDSVTINDWSYTFQEIKASNGTLGGFAVLTPILECRKPKSKEERIEAWKRGLQERGIPLVAKTYTPLE